MTDRYAVIGNPIEQSKSPLIHTAFARVTGQDIDYGKVLGPLDGFAQAVDAFRAAGGRGMNVTAPFKLDAFAYATDLAPSAQMAGAVNAMKFEGERVYAENFDGIGLVRDVVHNLARPQHQQGAVPVQGLGYEQLQGPAFDLVFNASSSSLTAELPPITAAVFAPGALAYDLTYGKGLTPFLRLAQQAGVSHLADGVGMLAEQAAEAFAWWRGVRPDTQDVIRQLSVPLV